MSDKRISELVELTSLAADDELPVVDADANATKRVTFDTLATEVRTETSTLNLGDSTAISRLAADQYRLTADATSDGTLTAWERTDEARSTTLGSGVSESAGTFNVPSDGTWLIIFTVRGESDSAAGDNFVAGRLSINGSLYGTAGMGNNDASFNLAEANMFLVVNLLTSDDIITSGFSVAAGALLGSTTENLTTLTFIRLGDA